MGWNILVILLENKSAEPQVSLFLTDINTMDTNNYIDLAKTYVALSNKHNLDLIAQMFAGDTTYYSSYFGEFKGCVAINEMMISFFSLLGCLLECWDVSINWRQMRWICFYYDWNWCNLRWVCWTSWRGTNSFCAGRPNQPYCGTQTRRNKWDVILLLHVTGFLNKWLTTFSFNKYTFN